jgi:serralysin
MCVLCIGLKSSTCPSIGGKDVGGAGVTSGALNNKPSLTTDQVANKIGLFAWGNPGIAITYGYRSTSTDPDFVRFNAEQIRGTELALSMWADVANVNFQRVGSGTTGEQAYSNNATILFNAASQGDFYAYAYYPGDRASGSLAGDVYFNNQDGSLLDLSHGSYGYLAALHEIGHALGITHPGAYNGGSPNYADNAEYREDSRQYTVMSYFNAEETGAVHGFNFAVTPLLHDIAAVQKLYGANMSTRTGNTVYGFNSNADRSAFHITLGQPAPIFAVWDAGGTDTLDFSGYAMSQVITLAAEGFSSVGGLVHNVAIAKGAVIENARGGSGADVITGNAAANVIDGNNGNDSLSGDAGNDILNGGNGADTIDGGIGSDLAIFELTRGEYTVTTALVNSAVRFSITSNATGVTDYVTNVENFRFADGTYTSTQLGGSSNHTATDGTEADDTLAGSAGRDMMDGKGGNDDMSGGSGDDRLTGGLGDDTLDGGAGNDILIGGAGNDTYVVDSLTDRVTETAGGGNDTVLTGLAAYRLAAEVENLTTTRATGATLAGNALANRITGNVGNDNIDGLAGNDTMAGGLGDDIYGVDSLGDVVDEAADAGRDTIRTGLARYTLGDNVEVLIGTALTAQNLIGNAANNEIRGSSGADTLDGGTGADVLAGGMGNDLYLVDNSGDRISEMAAGGYDTVRSSAASTTLDHNIEELVGLLGTGQTLTGNATANKITAGAGNDTINDGAGNDTVNAGSGNDLVRGSAGNDVLAGGEDYDTLDFSGAASALRFDATLRKVTGTATGIDTYSGFEELRGSAFADTFTGSAGADIFLGLGGADMIRGGKGADVLTGGTGRDTYSWLAGDADGAVDTITDFAAEDILNVRGLLAGRTFASLDQKVMVSDGATGTTISVNMGSTLGFVDIAHLDGVHGLTAETMLAQGMLLA